MMMDPNKALTTIREVIAGILDGSGACEVHELDEMAESFQALDEWITKGGFLPEAWCVIPGSLDIENALDWLERHTREFIEAEDNHGAFCAISAAFQDVHRILSAMSRKQKQERAGK
jgi:hypothetical protein